MTYRRVRDGDIVTLYRWRNEDAAVRTSQRGQPVSWDEHLAWFCRAMSSTEVFVMAEINDEPVGHVRVDDDGSGDGVVSIVVDEKHRGRGIATAMLLAVRPRAGDTWNAMVLANNEPSVRAFTRAGYRLVADKQGPWQQYALEGR